MLPSNRIYGFWLAVARVVLGGLWLAHGIPKFTGPGFMPPDGFMPKMVAQAVAQTAGPYHDFLANVVAPNVGLFAELVRLGEVLTGCVLVLGLFSRLGGLAGMFLTANYMLAQGEMSSIAGWSGLDGAMFVLCAINFILPTGRSFGLDWLLSRPRAVVAPVAVSAAAAPSSPTVTAPSGAVQAEFVDERPLDGPSAPTG